MKEKERERERERESKVKKVIHLIDSLRGSIQDQWLKVGAESDCECGLFGMEREGEGEKDEAK